VGGIDTAGNVGANLGANWGLKDFQSIAVDACGSPHPVWAVDDGTPATEAAVSLTPCTTAQPGVPESPWTGLILLLMATVAVVAPRSRRLSRDTSRS